MSEILDGARAGKLSPMSISERLWALNRLAYRIVIRNLKRTEDSESTHATPEKKTFAEDEGAKSGVNT